MRDALGDGYTEALRAAYPEVTSTADLVMYWWHKAAALLCAGELNRFGFITTNSITQVFNRKVIEPHMGEGRGKLALVWAIADHPWVVDGAAVRIAMTVADDVSEGHTPTVVTVDAEVENGREAPKVELSTRTTGRIHADLRGGANVAAAKGLRAGKGLVSHGVMLASDGFKLTAAQMDALDPDARLRTARLVRPYLNGDHIIGGSAPLWLVDAFGHNEASLLDSYPAAYQHLMNRVRPSRLAKKGVTKDSETWARDWYLFGKTRPQFRASAASLHRYIVTVETMAQRAFQFVDVGYLPDHMLVAISSADAAILGVLSSGQHHVWAAAAGGRLGKGNDQRYNTTRCFDPFPFPDPTPTQRARIADLGERLDAHRKARQALHPDLTLTGMYNVLEKIRAGTPLTDKERAVNEKGLVSLLRELHDALDAAVAEAYGWPAALDDEAILERLVALNAERAAEEKRGLVRWLRPEYQRPLAGEPEPVNAPLPGLDTGEGDTPIAAVAEKLRWMPALSDRIGAVRAVVLRAPGGVSLEAVASTFVKAPRKEVESILDSLAALGIVNRNGAGPDRRWHPLRA